MECIIIINLLAKQSHREESEPVNITEGTGVNEPQKHQQQGVDKKEHMEECAPENIAERTGQNRTQNHLQQGQGVVETYRRKANLNM